MAKKINIWKSVGKVKSAKELGLNIIPGGCPMMFCEPVDVAHKCFRWLFGVTGKLPKVL